MPSEDRWRAGENSPRCPLCRDSGWLKRDDARFWEHKPADRLVPCPCRHEPKRSPAANIR